MKTYKRRWFAFVSFQPPQRYFIVMQFVILGSMMLFLLYSSFELVRNYATQRELHSLSESQLHGYVFDFYQSFLSRVVTIFCAGFLLNVLFGLLYLHRITGPLVRVRHVLNKIAEGEFPAGMVRFRKDDFLNDIAISLSRLLDFLNRMRVSMRVEKEKPTTHSGK